MDGGFDRIAMVTGEQSAENRYEPEQAGGCMVKVYTNHGKYRFCSNKGFIAVSQQRRSTEEDSNRMGAACVGKLIAENCRRLGRMDGGEESWLDRKVGGKE